MTYRLNQDPDTLTKTRSILASPTLVGSEAWELPEDELTRKAEIVMNSFAGNVAALRLAARPIGEAIQVSTFGRFGSRAIKLRSRPPDEMEQLMECAAWPSSKQPRNGQDR
jgi:hypothetical protein